MAVGMLCFYWHSYSFAASGYHSYVYTCIISPLPLYLSHACPWLISVVAAVILLAVGVAGGMHWSPMAHTLQEGVGFRWVCLVSLYVVFGHVMNCLSSQCNCPDWNLIKLLLIIHIGK